MRAVLACLVVTLVACGSNRSSDAGPQNMPRPTFRVAFLSDTKGYLEPCGCTSRPLGGLGRLGTALETLRADRTPTFLVTAGDLFFGGPVTDAGAAAEERWQAEALVDVWSELGVVAATIGRKDLERADELPALRHRSRFPWIAAGATPLIGPDAGIPEGATALAPLAHTPLASIRMLEQGGKRLGIVGVSDAFDLAAVMPAAREAVARARTSGAVFVIMLVRGDRTLARRVASIEGVNLVLLGGLDQELPSAPLMVGDALIVQGGRQGQRLVAVDVYVRDDGAFSDVSPWSSEAAGAELRASIREREQEITRWVREGRTSEADIAAQRARVDAMKRELATLERPRDLSAGNLLSARVIELSPDIASDTRITARLREHDRRVNEHNRTALADRTPIPVPEGLPSYAGSQSCQSCHTAAYTWWQGHLHGRAYQTLVSRDKQFSLNCVSCHVTGYGQPGGATVTHNMGGALVNVGCESCHGPGSAHNEDPASAPLPADVPETTCVTCHNAEHSDRFQYRAYREAIRAPGHGRPMPPR